MITIIIINLCHILTATPQAAMSIIATETNNKSKSIEWNSECARSTVITQY